MKMTNDRQNEGIIRFASRVKDAVSLRSGGGIVVNWLPENNTGHTYYVSIFHDAKAIGVGLNPTRLTVEKCCDIASARTAAMALAHQWNYEVQERV
jgi:hypothetical protein